MVVTSLIDFRPVDGGLELRGIACIYGSPSPDAPAYWKKTSEWAHIPDVGGDAEWISENLNAVVRGLSSQDSNDVTHQYAVLKQFAGRVLPSGIVQNLPEMSRGMLSSFFRRHVTSQETDFARYKARRERLHATQ